MNTHELNSAELNGDSVSFSLISLGAVSTGITFYVYEETSEPMRALVSINFDAYGDLTRVIQIGSGQTGIDFSTTGVLVRDPTVYIGAVSAALTFNTSSAMNTRQILGAISTGLTFASSGSLNRGIQLSATGGITFATSAILTQLVKKPLGDVAGSIALDTTGNLTNYANLTTIAGGISFTVSGLLTTNRYISGTTGITFSVSGTLFNNPTAEDPDGYTVVRPYVDRTVVRRS